MAVKKKVVEIDTQQATTSVKDLRQQLKQLKDAMLSAEEGTEEYNKALQQAADIQHTLKEQTEELNASAMDFGQITSNLVKATGGLVAGLQAAKATMNLFGIENEAVLESLQKMQNLMAITQALPAIESGVKAFRRLGTAIKSAAAATGTLGKALMASGIGLAVAAVAALAANWDKVKIALGLATEKQKEYNLLVNGFTEQQEAEANIMKKAGQSNVEILRFRKKALEDNLKAEEEYIKHLEDERNEVLNMNLPANELARELSHIAAEMEGAGKNSEIFKEKLDEVNAELKIEEEVLARVWQRMIDIENASNKGILGVEKSLQEELDEKFAGKPIKIPVEFVEPEDEENIDNTLVEKYKTIIEMAKEAAITPESVYNEELRLLNIALDQKKISYDEYYAYLKQLESKKLEGTYAYFTAVANVAQTALSDIGGMFSALADVQDATTKEGFEQQKKYQIAAATMNMLGGIVSAWTSAMDPANSWMTIWGQIGMGVASSAMILATGLLQIQKIKQQTMNGSGNASASPSTSALATINAPVQYTQDVQGASIEGSIKDTRVVVTEGDISSTQKKVHVAESEATF